jgi:hypothetical protein
MPIKLRWQSIVLVQNHNSMQRLDIFVEDESEGLCAKHKWDITGLEEQRLKHYERQQQDFKAVDKNGDGCISKQEYGAQ